MGTGVCVAVTEYHRLRVFETRMVRKIFWPKREEVTGDLWNVTSYSLKEIYQYFLQNLLPPFSAMKVGGSSILPKSM
jgi:hypothetical protein